MLPVIAMADGCGNPDTILPRLLAERLDIAVDDIVDFDLSLYDTTPACLVGLNGEFITSGRLDDLSMAYSAMTALTESDADCAQTRVMAIFDNEETGSGTKQGAASPELANLLSRIAGALGADNEDYFPCGRPFIHDFGRQRPRRPSQLCREAGPDKSSPSWRWSCHKDKCQLQIHD